MILTPCPHSFMEVHMRAPSNIHTHPTAQVHCQVTTFTDPILFIYKITLFRVAIGNLGLQFQVRSSPPTYANHVPHILWSSHSRNLSRTFYPSTDLWCQEDWKFKELQDQRSIPEAVTTAEKRPRFCPADNVQ
jgi:hypothetical protein